MKRSEAEIFLSHILNECQPKQGISRFAIAEMDPELVNVLRRSLPDNSTVSVNGKPIAREMTLRANHVRSNIEVIIYNQDPLPSPDTLARVRADRKAVGLLVVVPPGSVQKFGPCLGDFDLVATKE